MYLVHYFKSGERKMRAYAEAYLNDVVENQGKLFDFEAQSFPDKDTEEVINTYMKSKACCFNDIESVNKILNTNDVKEIKQLGRLVQDYNENCWSGIRQLIVYDGLRGKFLQNEELKKIKKFVDFIVD